MKTKLEKSIESKNLNRESGSCEHSLQEENFTGSFTAFVVLSNICKIKFPEKFMKNYFSAILFLIWPN